MKHYREVTFITPFNFSMKTVKQPNKKAWKGLILKGKSRVIVLLSLTSTFSALCRDTARYLDQTLFTLSKHVKKK